MKIDLKIKQVPVILFALLVIYIFLIIFFANRELIGDEVGYSNYAENITHGFYTNSDDVNIWWEPGYPLILALFKLMHFPVILTKLVNAVFYFIAVILFYKAALIYTDEKKSLIAALLLGIYPNYIRQIFYQNSEPLSCLLIAIIIYFSLKLFKDQIKSYKLIIVLGITIGYLALTKAIFGYVIVTCILIFLVSYIFVKNKYFVKMSLLIFITSLIFCLPYLFYTYNLTGKIFFWSNRGGVNIYHSTTPIANEYGDWYGYNIYEDNPEAMKNHEDVLKLTKDMKALEKDDKFREIGIEQFKHHPVKFVYNWFCGLGRLMFNYPFSYTYQKPDTYFFILPNMFLFVFVFISLGIFLTHRKMFPQEFSFAFIFSLIYFGGISLVAAVARYAAPFYPLFFLIIMYVFLNIIKIEKVKFNK